MGSPMEIDVQDYDGGIESSSFAQHYDPISIRPENWSPLLAFSRVQGESTRDNTLAPWSCLNTRGTSDWPDIGPNTNRSTTQPQSSWVDEYSHDHVSVLDDSVGALSSLSVPELLHCDECDAEFRGDYRRGNLNRHRRLYHGSQGGYPCHDQACPRVFRRQDSRLKHHRRHHPYLGEQAPASRSSGPI